MLKNATPVAEAATTADPKSAKKPISLTSEKLKESWVEQEDIDPWGVVGLGQQDSAQKKMTPALDKKNSKYQVKGTPKKQEKKKNYQREVVIV